MSERIFQADNLFVTAVVGPANGESDRARLEFHTGGEISAQLDKFDVTFLRRALTKWAKEHPKRKVLRKRLPE